MIAENKNLELDPELTEYEEPNADTDIFQDDRPSPELEQKPALTAAHEKTRGLLAIVLVSIYLLSQAAVFAAYLFGFGEPEEKLAILAQTMASGFQSLISVVIGFYFAKATSD